MAGMNDMLGVSFGLANNGMAAQQLARGPTDAEAASSKWAMAFDEMNRAAAEYHAAGSRHEACVKAHEDAWRELNAVAAGEKFPVKPPEDGNLYGSKYGTRKG